MALKVWLPFNGNLKNQGLGTDGVGKGTIAYSAGKIGQCIDFSANANVASGSENMVVIPGLQLPTFTFCAWVKVTSAAIQDDQIVAREGKGYNANGWDITINKNTNKIAASASWISYTFPDTGEVNKWYHIAFTHANQVNYWYFNGELVYSANCGDVAYDTTTTSDGNAITFGARGRDGAYHWPFQGCINDFRLYDEALSPKQIKEISKGLVAHYKLDTQRAIDNLKRNATYGTYNNFASSGSTCAVVDTGTTYMGAKVYRMTYTPNETSLSSVQTSLHSHGVTTPSQTFKANTKYCYWTLCKPISHPDSVVGGTASNIGNWTEIPMKEYGNGWYIVGQSRNGTVTSDKTDTIFTSFKTPSATSGTPIIIDFCCPHLVEGYDYIVPEFDYAGTAVTQEKDVGGNGYNGTISGTLTYNNNTPRYEGCTKFDANTSYIKLPALTTGGFANSFTIIYWENIADMNGKMAWGFSDGNRLNIYPTSSVICCNTGDGANNPYQNNGSSIAYSQWNNGWHQFAMVADGSTNKLYVDGQLQGTAKTYKGITGTQMYISGWDAGTSYRWVNGSISDFRIYATALSADNILTMYKNSGIIDNKGNIYAYEFKEE